MTFVASSGRIRVTDADGVEKLDTNDGLLHVVGSQKSGTINIPEYLLSNGQTQNDTQTWDLGSCNAACNVVIGAVRFSGTAAGAIGFDRWTSYMGGDLIWILASPPKLASGSMGGNPSDLVAYRFYVSGAKVWMAQRRVVLGGPGTNKAGYRAHAIQYRLKTCVFT